MNAQRFNVYVSVNAVRPGVRARTKSAIGTIRHLFLEADHDGIGVLARLASRADIPPPSYVLESSPNRVHIFWRVAGFTNEKTERLQKHLAAQFGTDVAATALRVAGFDVQEAADGQAALVALEEDSPALVILDLGLPTIDGHAVHAELARRSPGIPVLVVTGSIRRVAGVPPACVLRKPVSPDQVLDSVVACLKSVRTRGRV